MKFDILHRNTRAVIFTADIDCAEDTPHAQKLRLAVIKARKEGGNLAYSDLSGADLSELDLTGLDFPGAILIGSDFTGSDLTGCYLTDAILTRAILINADLTDANLTRANLTRAILINARLFDTVGIIPLGSPNGLYAYAWLRDGWLSVRIGPDEKRLDEARACWGGGDDRREVMAALGRAETMAELRGWPIKAPDLQAGGGMRKQACLIKRASPEDITETIIQAAIDSAPDPLRRLGEWLACKLDSDDWGTADSLLNGIAVAFSVLKKQRDEARHDVSNEWRHQAQMAESALSAKTEEFNRLCDAIKFSYWRPPDLMLGDPRETPEFKKLWSQGDVRQVYVNQGEFIMFESALAALNQEAKATP